MPAVAYIYVLSAMLLNHRGVFIGGQGGDGIAGGTYLFRLTQQHIKCLLITNNYF